MPCSTWMCEKGHVSFTLFSSTSSSSELNHANCKQGMQIIYAPKRDNKEHLMNMQLPHGTTNSHLYSAFNYSPLVAETGKLLSSIFNPAFERFSIDI
jgi:hypothetical protein